MDLFDRHYPEEGRFEESAYYYWYRYMNLVEGYGPRHPLWVDFGDVKMPFWEWWCAYGEDLFMTGEKPGFQVLASERDIQDARKDGAYIVRIDPDCTRNYLMFYFREFLREKNIREVAGRRLLKEEMKFARYPFYQRPDVKSLRISLDAWELRKKMTGPENKKHVHTLYQIGCLLKVNPSAVIKKNDVATDRLLKKNVMNATVSRYLKWAENIKKNVAKGIFPKNTSGD